LIEFAYELQQSYYEFLPECTKYKPNEHKYLKQNIGYAIYGPPEKKDDSAEEEKPDNSTKENKSDSTEETKCDDNAKENKSENTESNDCSKSENSNNTDADIADIVDYNEEQKVIINKIYEKICVCVEENNSQPIYFGVIYNVIIFEECVNSEKENQPKQQVDNKEENETEQTDVTKKNNLPISSFPIFTIRKNIKKQSDTTNTATDDETSYETWYLDTATRVYKDWSDYKINNTIPECIMILPKDGCYQADESKPITEDYSTVWLETMDSPACSLTTKLCKGLDIASTVVGIGGIGLCLASMFTPVGPVIGAAGKSSIYNLYQFVSYTTLIV